MNHISILEFDDFIVINREKIASRLMQQLYTQYLHQKHNSINESHLRYLDGSAFRHLFSYQLTIQDNEILPLTLELPTIDEWYDELNLKTKIEKLELTTVYDILKSIQESSIKTLNSIIEGKCDKKILFLYRNPDKALITGIFQDIMEISGVFTSQLHAFINFGVENNSWTTRLKELLLLNSNMDNLYTNTEFNINLKQILHHIETNSDTKEFDKRIISNFISNLLLYDLKCNGIGGNHKGLWLSSVLPFVGKNKDVVLLDIDKEEYIDFKEIFSDLSDGIESNLSIDWDYTKTNSIKNESNKQYVDFIKELLNNSEETSFFIENFYLNEKLQYKITKKDYRNI